MLHLQLHTFTHNNAQGDWLGSGQESRQPPFFLFWDLHLPINPSPVDAAAREISRRNLIGIQSFYDFFSFFCLVTAVTAVAAARHHEKSAHVDFLSFSKHTASKSRRTFICWLCIDRRSQKLPIHWHSFSSSTRCYCFCQYSGSLMQPLSIGSDGMK